MLGVVVYRRIDLPAFHGVLAETAKQTGTTMLLVASAFILNYAIANERLAQSLVTAISALQLTPIMFMWSSTSSS